MNTFSGSLTFEWRIDTEGLPFVTITNDTPLGTNVFIYGETEFSSSREVVDSMKQRILWTLLSFDISIETEDRMKLFPVDPVSGKYHFVAFHGKTFEEVLKAVSGSTERIISVREAEESDKLWGRVIKVDVIAP